MNKLQKMALVLLLTTFSFCSQAQYISGKVMDSSNHIGLANVNVSLKGTSKSTVSNNDGDFIIFIGKTSNDCILIFSCIGFESKEVNLQFKDQIISINLNPKIFTLNEVVVKNNESIAIHFLKQVLEKVQDNYSKEDKLISAFYNEAFYKAGQLNSYKEAAVQAFKSSYSKNVNNPIYLIKKRQYIDSISYGTNSIINGPTLINDNDYVYKRDSIFNEDFFRNTRFEYLKSSDYENINIAFKSKRTDLYNGFFTINKSDSAINKIHLYKKLNSNKNSVTDVYYKNINGVYFLNSIKKTMLKNDIIIVANIVVNDISNNAIPNAISYQSNSDLSTYKNDFSPGFWQNYDYLKADSSIRRELINLQKRNTYIKRVADISQDEKVIYRPHLILLLADNFKLEPLQINEIFSQSERVVNYYISKKVTNSSFSSFLQLIVPEIITTPLRNIIAEKNYLKKHNIVYNINFSIINKFGRSYLYGIPNADLANWKMSSNAELLRIYTLRQENNYLSIKNLEEEIFQKGLDRNDNLDLYLKLYFIDLFSKRIKQFGNIIFAPLLSTKASLVLNEPFNANPLYSFIRYLHKPNSAFMGSINKEMLDDSENKFLKRVQLKSLLNLISPLMIASPAYPIGYNSKMNFSLNYMPVPHGELYEERFYIKSASHNFGVFIRQYQNYYKMGLGLALKSYGYQLSNNLYIDTEISYWKQPQNQLFYDKEFADGFSWNQMFIYKPFKAEKTLNRLSMVAGVLVKTKGYIPESFSLNSDLLINWGLKINL